MISYHSALHPDHASAPAVHSYQWANGSRAFVHDLTKPLPALYWHCDVLYSDPPWRAGQPQFNVRAGASTTWDAVMAAWADLIDAVPIPVVLVLGKQALKRLPKPHELHETTLVDRPALLGVWNWAIPIVPVSVEDYLQQLAQRYDCVGDPCCGYGSAALAFHRAGKRFIVSDYNPCCIGRLVEQVNGA